MRLVRTTRTAAVIKDAEEKAASATKVVDEVVAAAAAMITTRQPITLRRNRRSCRLRSVIKSEGTRQEGRAGRKQQARNLRHDYKVAHYRNYQFNQGCFIHK
jgi:hypothetical protein